MVIEGSGFFDSTQKKAMFKSEHVEKTVEVVFSKKDSTYRITIPSLNSLSESEEALEKVKNSGV